MTGDISAGGIFVPSEESAVVGEEVELALKLPNNQEVKLVGKVVVVIDKERAEQLGKSPGLGIQIIPPTEPREADEFETLLKIARARIPAAPEELPALFDESRPLIMPPEATTRLRPKAKPKPEPQAPPAAPEVFARTPGPDPIVGIDLGNTYTSVAVCRDNQISVLRDSSGHQRIATAVAFPDRHQMLVGNVARQQLAHNPDSTVVSLRRILGRAYRDREIEQFLFSANYKAEEAADGSVTVMIHKEPHAVAQLLSYVLAEIKRIAEKHLEREVRRAVITVPANFGEPQIKALRRAAKMAHLEVVALIDEPTAATLANRQSHGFEGVIGIYDFGGGTFDISLVDVSSGDFRVLVTGGDSWLGGDDFDAALSNAVADRLWRTHNVEIRHRAVELQKLLMACEKTKRTLSTETEAQLIVPQLLRTESGMVDVRMSIDRGTFRKLCDPVIEQSLETVRQAMTQAEIRPDQMSAIFLSGGSTYIPAVRDALQASFGVRPTAGVAPEYAACVGAAIYAAHLQARLSTTRD